MNRLYNVLTFVLDLHKVENAFSKSLLQEWEYFDDEILEQIGRELRQNHDSSENNIV